MQVKLPVELQEARKLLDQSEKESNNDSRARMFNQAIDILNDHLTNEPDSPYKSLVEEIKLTYTRKLLEELSDEFDLRTWVTYFFMLITVTKELKILFEKRPDLKTNYLNFLGSFTEEDAKLIKFE